MDVPESRRKPLLSEAPMMPTPGATKSGFRYVLEPSFTGPRELNGARTSFLSVAPMVMTCGSIAGGYEIVEHPGPSFPALTDMKIPAARRAFTAEVMAFKEQPSYSGQPYEFPTTCGLKSGRGFLPYIKQAMNASKELVYCAVQLQKKYCLTSRSCGAKKKFKQFK